ncbi:MAG: tetratricopeptide repeat protein [Caldimicrobium sp.]
MHKAIELWERVGDYHGVAKMYLNLGSAYIKVKSYELAERYLTEGLKRIQRVGDKYWEAYGYEYLGDLYLDKGDNKFAVEYYSKAYNLYKNIGAKSKAEELEKLSGSALYWTIAWSSLRKD